MRTGIAVVLAVAVFLPCASAWAAPATNHLAIVKKGRGYTIETSAVDGAAVLHAKDHVDIVAAVADPVTHRLSAITLLQNVIVLANASPGPGEPRQLTLLVLPEEAELLALARQAGHLTATLRNPTDMGVMAQRRALTLHTLLRPAQVKAEKHEAKRHKAKK